MPDSRIYDPLLTPGVRPGENFGVVSTGKRVGTDGTCCMCPRFRFQTRRSMSIWNCWDRKCQCFASCCRACAMVRESRRGMRSVGGVEPRHGTRSWGSPECRKESSWALEKLQISLTHLAAANVLENTTVKLLAKGSRWYIRDFGVRLRVCRKGGLTG
jgi:hypothetical protein